MGYLGHGSDLRVRFAELILRFLICGFGVVCAVLVGSDSQVKEFFTIQKKAKFTEMKALVFLVIANGIAAGYCLIHGVRCVLSLVRGSVVFSKPLAWIIFSGDQVMAYITLSAAASATQSALYAKFGQSELQWMKICDMYEKFCNQIAEGIASGIIVSLGMVILSWISAFSLFRLYGRGGHKANSTSRDGRFWWSSAAKFADPNL